MGFERAFESYEHIAFSLAKADLTYVASAILGSEGNAQVWPFLQYGSMVAYETKKYSAQAAQWDLHVEWDEEIAVAARMSGKFFEDNRRLVHGVVGHFQAQIDANHGAFFPPDRRGRIFDFLRNDLAVAFSDNVPIVTNVGGPFLAGLSPDHVVSLDGIGPRIHRLARGIGNVTAQLVGTTELDQHHRGFTENSDVTWWDGKSRQCFPRMFAGELEPSLAAALMTIQGTCVVTERFARSQCCTACEFAALKHRFIVLYQSAKSLDSLINSQYVLGEIARHNIAQALEVAEHPLEILAPHYRRLRNGLVHLGFGDVSDQLMENDLGSVIYAYTGHDQATLAAVVDTSLKHVADTLTKWVLTPVPGGRNFLHYLRKPD